jgi:protein subunit release factor B
MTWTLLISAGRGPAEVRAFARQLAEALAPRLAAAIADPSDGAVVLRGDGPAPTAWLGTHALVAALRGRGQRKRWFVAVSLVDEPAPVDRSGPIRQRADRAGGPGGQHVNRTASAVRVVHEPTGIAVRVADRRSQHQNRADALRRLDQRFDAIDARRQAQARAARRDAHDQVVRGAPSHRWTLRDGALQPEEGR